MVDERQVARDVLDNLFEKTHCDCNVDWCLYETYPELQIGEWCSHIANRQRAGNLERSGQCWWSWKDSNISPAHVSPDVGTSQTLSWGMLQEYVWCVCAVEMSLFSCAGTCRRLLAFHHFHYFILHKMKEPCEFQGDEKSKHTSTQIHFLKRQCCAGVLSACITYWPNKCG